MDALQTTKRTKKKKAILTMADHLKEPLTEVKKEVESVPAALPAPPPSEGEKEEKKSNGAHTPV